MTCSIWPQVKCPTLIPPLPSKSPLSKPASLGEYSRYAVVRSNLVWSDCREYINQPRQGTLPWKIKIMFWYIFDTPCESLIARKEKTAIIWSQTSHYLGKWKSHGKLNWKLLLVFFVLKQENSKFSMNTNVEIAASKKKIVEVLNLRHKPTRSIHW